MLYLLLAILCGTLISIFMRLSTPRVESNMGMLAMNYSTCLILGLAHTGLRGIFPASPALPMTLGFGAVNGALFLSCLVIFQLCIRRSGIVLSSIFMKLGLLVPMVISVVFFREMPSALQALGFVLAIAAIVLINTGDDTEKKDARFQFSLILLLLVGGSCDASNKIFDELFPAELASQFLLYTFGFALIFSLILMLRKKEHPGKWELLFGIMVGIPNYYSSRFLLKSLSSVPAVIAYPSLSVATMLLITLAGIFAFREKLSKRRWTALGIIIAALVLLNI